MTFISLARQVTITTRFQLENVCVHHLVALCCAGVCVSPYVYM